MNLTKFIVYSTAGAFLWSMLLVYAGTVLGENWVDIREALRPFDLLIAVLIVVGRRPVRLVPPRAAGSPPQRQPPADPPG